MKPPVYFTKRLQLRPYIETDIDRYLETTIDPVSVQFMGNLNQSIQTERELFYRIFQLYKNSDSDRWFWVWAIVKEDIYCGHIELKQTPNTSFDELEIVYMIHPNERRKGFMKEVLEFFKNKQHIWKRKIIATINPENKNSKILLSHWGIEKEKLIIDKEDRQPFLKIWLKSTI